MYRRDFLKRVVLGSAGVSSLVVLEPYFYILDGIRQASGDLVRRTVQSMGTRVHLRAFSDGMDGSHIRSAIAEIEAVDRLMSVHRAKSDLSRVNRSAGGPVRVDPRTLEVARAALEFAGLTNGALDPTVLPLMRYWGFMEAQGTIPEARQLGPCLDRVGYGQLRVHNEWIELGQAEVDFGGIAKGYAVDRAVGQMRKDGMPRMLIEAGGDLYAAGRPDRDRCWQIGIRDPQRPNRIFAIVDMEDEAAATSGGYEKFRAIGNRRVPHLLDPRTGKPAQEIISATLFAPTTMEADALATATYILGVKAGLELVGQRPGVEGVWISVDGRRWVSPGLAGRIRWV